MSHRGCMLVLLLAIVGASSGCSSSGRTPPWAEDLPSPVTQDASRGGGVAPGIDATETIDIDPFAGSGLTSGWTLDRSGFDPTTPLDCSFAEPSSSATGPGTVTCGATADAATACWASPESTLEIWCLDSFDPSSTELRVLAADQVLSDVPAPADPSPVFLELADGSRWWLRTGGAWGSRADGGNPVYGCANAVGACEHREDTSGGLFILAYPGHPVPDQSDVQWTVEVGETGAPDDEFPAPEQLDVTRAWFLAGHVSGSE